MPPEFLNAIALQRELFAVTLDPLSNREVRRSFLPVGTLIEDPRRSLADAKARGADEVIVRSLDRAGRAGVERVNAESLRAALPKVR